MPERLIIDYVSALILLVGIALSFAAGRSPTDSRKVEFKYVSAMLLGGAFVFYGLSTALAIHSASHATVVGMLTDLRQSCGRYNWSYFTVTSDDDSSVRLHTDYCGDYLQEFQNVSVNYVEGFETVTDLQIVPNGWKLHEGDGSLTSLLVCLIGVAAFFRSK